MGEDAAEDIQIFRGRQPGQVETVDLFRGAAEVRVDLGAVHEQLHQMRGGEQGLGTGGWRRECRARNPTPTRCRLGLRSAPNPVIRLPAAMHYGDDDRY